MRTLWGRRTSINVQKVVWVLTEMGLTFDHIEVGGAHRGTDTAAYLGMNPTGRVPTLEDGAFTLWESNAICRYLTRTYRGALACADPREAARADMWMEWFQNGAYAAFIEVFYQTVRLPKAERRAEDLEAALATLARHFALVETELAGRPFLNGTALSLADIPFGASLFRYFDLDIPRPDFPAIRDYYARLTARPAYRDAVMVGYESLCAAE